MTRLLEFLIATAIVAVLFLLVAIFLPSSRHLTEQVDTSRNRTIVFDTLNSFSRFKDWNAITARDPATQLTISGPASGEGARIEYRSSSKGIGAGSWEIAKSVPGEQVTYKLDNEQRGNDKTLDFTLKSTGQRGQHIQITQDYSVHYGWDLIGRFAGIYVRSSVGEDMKTNMRRLSTMLAAVPNQDYRQEGLKLRDMAAVELPAENLLTVHAGAIERHQATIRQSMEDNRTWIQRVMDANDLEAAGPLRIITTELSRETYTFDVVLPVKKKGSAGDDGELSVNVPDGAPVIYERTAPSRVVKAQYTGYMAELELIRPMLRAWAMTHGHDAAGRPFENYVNGIDNAYTEAGEFEVFWPIREAGQNGQAAAAVQEEALAEQP